MNILHISSASTWRGGERQVQYLIEGLQNNGDSNYLMSPKESILSSRLALDPSHIIEFRKGILSLVQNIKALKRFCIKNQIDLIHGHDSHAHSLVWMAYQFGGLKKKSVITRRLINPVKNRSSKKYNYSKIEKIICISEAVKNVLGPFIEDHSRLKVIHSAIDTAVNEMQSGSIKKSEYFTIGYVAAFTEEKDHKTFLATAKYLIDNYPEISFKFMLVGSGILLEDIRRESKNIQDRIEFTGFIKNIDEVYMKFNLLLHTSKSEALGTSILDAMRFQLPIISTKVGGIPEIVMEGKNGYLFNIEDYKSMGDQIYKIAKDKDLYDSLSSNSAQILSEFDIKKMINKHLTLYAEVYK